MHFFTGLMCLVLIIPLMKSQDNVMKVIEMKTVISLFQSERLLSADQLSKLQKEIFTAVLTDLKNNCDMFILSQTLEQLVTQYLPQLQIEYDYQWRKNQINRIFFSSWIDFSQSIIDDVASVLLHILSDAPGGLGDTENTEFQVLLSQLPMEKYTKIVQIANNSDRPTALINLQELLLDFFSVQQSRSNFDDIAADLLNNLNHILPQLQAPLLD